VKRLILVLSTIILAASAFWGLVVNGLSQIPHEDPSTAETHFNFIIPLLHYGDIFTMIAERDYSQARELLQELKLDFTHLPEDVIFIMARYNDLSNELTNQLDKLEHTLDRCEQFLSENKLNEAFVELNEARKLISEVRMLIRNIVLATEELFHILAPFISPQDMDAINKAKARLQEAIDRLAELEAWYMERMQSLEEEAERKAQGSIETEGEPVKALLPTDVTLDIRPERVWVGERVTVFGRLWSTERLIGARQVSIFLDGEHTATITTFSDGTYETSFTLPYWYVPTIEVQASYVPTGDDKEIYTAASSEVEIITVLYHHTGLKTEVPERAYPGLPVRIGGKVESDGNVIGRSVSVFFDGEPLFEDVTDDNGLFWRNIMLDRETSTGEHRLRFTTTPDNEYRSAGTSTDSVLQVEKVTPEIELQAPRFILLPQKVELTGEAYSPLPLVGAALNLETGGTSSTIVVDEGRFDVKLALPLISNFLGHRNIKASLVPREPWHLSTSRYVSIYVINLIYVAIILAALILAWKRLLVVVPGIFRKRQIPFILQEETQGQLISTVFPILEINPVPGDNLGIMLRAYYAAVVAVQKLAMIFLKPQMTMREFLNQVKFSLGKFASLFERLTYMAEKALYSNHTIREDEALLAQNMASQVDMERVTSK